MQESLGFCLSSFDMLWCLFSGTPVGGGIQSSPRLIQDLHPWAVHLQVHPHVASPGQGVSSCPLPGPVPSLGGSPRAGQLVPRGCCSEKGQLSLGSVLLPTLLIPWRPLVFLGAISEQECREALFLWIKQTGKSRTFTTCEQQLTSQLSSEAQ